MSFNFSVKVDRLGFLLSQQREIEELKQFFRDAANGEKASFVGDTYVITVSSPGKPGETLDITKWKTSAPKEYSDVFKRYHKDTAGRAAAVSAAEKK